MNLSGTIIAYRLKHEPPLARANSLAPPRVFHLRMLPYATVGSYPTLFTLTYRSRRYSLCGTFPSWLLRRQPLAVRFYGDCSPIVSGLSSMDYSTVHICLGFCIMRDFAIFAKHPARYHRFARPVHRYLCASYRQYRLILAFWVGRLHGSYHDYHVRIFVSVLLVRK